MGLTVLIRLDRLTWVKGSRMDKRQRQYWAIRTSEDAREFLFNELKEGRIRQGWGNDPSQNLFIIQAEKEKGGDWRRRLNAAQKRSLPNYRLLGEGDDAIQVGDIILLPNLPTKNSFSLAEVTGQYYFDYPTHYEHVLPANLLTPSGIAKDTAGEEVGEEIYTILKPHNRIWRIRNAHEAYINSLIARYCDVHDPPAENVSIILCGGYPNPETRQKIEVAAIEFVTKWLTDRGFEVEDRQRDNCGYDLLAKSTQGNLKVEVKGTAASEPRFFITRNEWRSRIDPEWRLAFVTSAQSARTLWQDTLLTGQEVQDQFSLEALAWECKPYTP